MSKKKLNYRFHNPNPDSQTANYKLKVFLESNRPKVENAVQQAAQEVQAGEETEHEAITRAM